MSVPVPHSAVSTNRLGEPDEVADFRREVCAFITAELTDEARREHRDARAHNGWSAEFSAVFRCRMGERGLLDRGWPSEFGGGGARFQLALNEELQYHVAPGVDPTGTYVPSVLMAFGTPHQQQLLLPRLRRGEAAFFIGYSEPEAGSDLASLTTSATEDASGFVLTGQKMYSSYADRADFGLVIARSDPASERDQGLTLFIVDMREPGIRIAEHETIGGWIHHSVYFDHVRVPREMVVGNVHEGWPVVIGAIDFERATIAQPGRLDRQFDRLVAHALATAADGGRPADDDRVCDRLVGIAVEVEAARLYCQSLFRQDAPGHAGTLAALLGQEATRAADIAGLEQLGLEAQLCGEHAPFGGAVEHEYREHVVVQFAAGGFDVARNILATRALALRKSRAGVDAAPSAELPRLLADAVLDGDRRVLLADVARTADDFARREARRVGRSAEFDAAQWRELVELGWVGAAISEELGGLGAGLAPVAVIAEACGAEGLVTPLIDCGVATAALIEAAFGEQRLRWLEPLASGAICIAPALHETGPELSASSVRTILRKRGAGFRLSGTKLFVPYAAQANELVCLCRVGEEADDLGLAMVPTSAPGVEVARLATTNDDPAYVVRLADVAIDSDRVVLDGELIKLAVSSAIDRAATASAAELLGIGRGALCLTLAYVQERVQFGRPLARFQAVQHHSVDMYRDLEQTRILTEAAALRLDQGLAAERAASLAKIKAAEAVGAVVRTAHQLHGGIGYYTDYPLELLYRRSMRAQPAWGSARWHRARLTRLLREDLSRFRRDGAHPLPAPTERQAA